MKNLRWPRNQWQGGDAPGKAAGWAEAGGIGVIAALAIYLGAISWGKWCHPGVDSGRELYTPWRLAEGAVLYRDVDGVYGPFSQYFNAAWFRLFGPGLSVLMTANMAVFGGIAALSYATFRRAWGPAGAVASGGVLVALFAFCPLLDVGIFNYGFPYAHEATHGMLVILALTVAAGRWLESPGPGGAAGAGLCVGLTLVLKPEFMLAAGALSATACALARPDRRAWNPRSATAFIGAALLPTLAFFGYFAGQVPPGEALSAACRAWWSLAIIPDIVSMDYQRAFTGLDRPQANLIEHVRYTMSAVGLLGLLGGLTLLALRMRSAWARWSGVLALAGGAAFLGAHANLQTAGKGLLGLVLIYLCRGWWRWRGLAGTADSTERCALRWRMLGATVAVAMMARMVLNGRLAQFGFFQAALAAMVVVAVVCAEAAEWMPEVRGRRLAIGLVGAALFLPGLGWAVVHASHYYGWRTFAVGVGRDQFFYFTPDIEASGALTNEVVRVLRTMPSDTTLLTLPEGSMVNYLARLRSPLPQFQYYGFTTEGGRETAVVAALVAHPPDVVVVITRFGLGDFNIERYGERVGAGRQIIEWVIQNYQTTHHFGDDPLASDQRGAVIMVRKK